MHGTHVAVEPGSDEPEADAAVTRTRGTVLAFDELNCAEFPGETLALREVLGLSAHALRRDPNTPLASYLVI